ncbi:potassium channel subfamily K member 16-like [Zootoca vivipara]|uniref:potassium channel subfamily K member 16-like n=1 Tax=Zootoca vivipara TaxID=8524 RepID=UPI001591449C|nr:potassium channel subfamily K member 16-like [Zootoca vivipara]
MHMSRAQGTLLLAGLITYSVMGAFVFELLENDNYKRQEEKIYRLKEDFFLNYTSLSPEEVEVFIEEVVRYVRMGIAPEGTHNPEKQSSWDFTNSFFFVGTVLATVGYGNLCPQTKEGQLFCVIYALFGIPFNLICLNYIGFLISGLFESCAEKAFGKENKKTAKYIFLFVAMGVIMFLVLPAFLFQHAEGWSYHEAIYFTFITLSTIGFGDYLVGRNPNRGYFKGYRMLTAFFMVLGLAWIAVLFELVSSLLAPEEPQASSGKDNRQQK